MHLRALEDEGKHLRLGQVPTTKREHHNRKRAISRNVVSLGAFITTKTVWPKSTQKPNPGEGRCGSRQGERTSASDQPAKLSTSDETSEAPSGGQIVERRRSLKCTAIFTSRLLRELRATTFSMKWQMKRSMRPPSTRVWVAIRTRIEPQRDPEQRVQQISEKRLNISEKMTFQIFKHNFSEIKKKR